MGCVRCSFSDILQAIEDKLVADEVVTDRTQITWAVNNIEPPQLNTQFDVILRAHKAFRSSQDGGSFDVRFVRYVDIRMRTICIMDPGGGNKTWIAEQFGIEDRILNSIGNSQFFPKNGNNQNLTNIPLMPMADIAPEKSGGHPSSWGVTVCTLEAHYLPLLTPVRP